MQGAGVCVGGSGDLRAENAILAFGTAGGAIYFDGGGAATLTCCDIYGNVGGDWVGPIADQYGIDGNISADPLFCGIGGDDLRLHTDSPCAPGHNPDCGLIGAWPVGCEPTPVEVMTWGGIKALFRDAVR